MIDYLGGNGIFSNASQLEKWTVINESVYSVVINTETPNSPYLEIAKSENAMGAYDDGIYYYFGTQTPGHISLEMSTDSADVESCDLRLTTVLYNQSATSNFTKQNYTDVLFFRFGYFGYQKLNLQNMVNQFTNDTWYPIDLLVDYENQTVTSYVNDTLLASDIFFTDPSKPAVNTSNAIILYNLTPGTSCYIRNLQVCATRC